MHDTGDSRCIIRSVRLKFTGTQRLFKSQLMIHSLINGIGLIAIGHNGGVAQGTHSIVDNQMRVFQLFGVSCHGAQAALNQVKHAVAAVFAAAHDPVCHHGLIALGAAAQHNAAAGIFVGLQQLI